MSATSTVLTRTSTETVESLGSISEFDASLRLRRWFAGWLTGSWIQAWRLNDLDGPAQNAAHDGMEIVVSLLRGKLPFLTTSEQLRTMNGFAGRFGLSTTRAELLDALHEHFTLNPQRGIPPEDADAFNASRWCNTHAVRQHIMEQAGEKLLWKHYPRDGDLRLYLEDFITELVSEADLSTSVESAPLVLHRSPNDIRAAILRLPKDKLAGPHGLAKCIVDLLKKEWPFELAGLPADPAAVLSEAKLRPFIRRHLAIGAQPGTQVEEVWWMILRAIVRDENLRLPVLYLAQHARNSPQGWRNLQKVLTDVFLFIVRPPSDEERFRNFARMNFPSLRKQDEFDQFVQAQKHIKGTKKVLELDSDGKNSFSCGFRRAMKKVRSEINGPSV